VKEGFECEVMAALARLETTLEPLARDVREHRERLSRVEKTQLRMGVFAGAAVMILATVEQSVSSMLRAALSSFSRGG